MYQDESTLSLMDSAEHTKACPMRTTMEANGQSQKSSTGLKHDIFLLTDPTDPVVTQLRERFKEEPIFLEVIEALLDLDQGKSVRIRKRARHRASEYLIEDGRLWRTGGGHRSRARAKVECVTRLEATDLAKKEHEERGHWG